MEKRGNKNYTESESANLIDIDRMASRKGETTTNFYAILYYEYDKKMKMAPHALHVGESCASMGN